ncbi:MAG: hypothetical protein ACK4VI_08970 [Alphaproteobacteria bacterium]
MKKYHDKKRLFLLCLIAFACAVFLFAMPDDFDTSANAQHFLFEGSSVETRKLEHPKNQLTANQSFDHVRKVLKFSKNIFYPKSSGVTQEERVYPVSTNWTGSA